MEGAKRLQGKVAVVTGGACGIGAATAKLFAAEGALVVVADVQDELGERVCSEIGQSKAAFTHCDVTQESQVQAAADFAVDKWGALDVFMNNAGIVSSHEPSSLAELDMADFDQVMNVNARGTMLGTTAAARIMIPRRKGVIINMASIAALLPPQVLRAYAVSKHAVVGITKSSAAALAQHCIRVNCISPFLVPTALCYKWVTTVSSQDPQAFLSSMNRLQGHELTAEDVAKAALFLASDDSAYISGHNLVLDGAFTTTSAFA